MLWYENVIFYLAVVFSHLILSYSYKLISNKQYEINKKYIIIVLIASGFSTFNAYTNYTISKILIHFLIIVIMNKIIFKDSWKKIFYYCLVIYGIGLLIELITSITCVFLPFNNIKAIDENVFLKFIFTFFIMGWLFVICKWKKTRLSVNKMCSFLTNTNDFITIFISIILIIGFSITTFKTAIDYTSIFRSLTNIILTLVFITCLLYLSKQKVELEKGIQKQEELLDFISGYEKIIDKDRINRHEMLNNLLTIKSFPNKNSKEFDNIMNTIIEYYNTNGNNTIRNLYNLPSGLKGVVFYKVKEMQSLDVKVISNISASSINSFNSIDPKLYVRVCKIIGILLDNAKEAVSLAKKKELVLDFYKEDNDIVLCIENTYEGSVDLKLINNHQYSTKGKNRGYGLYIIDKIVKKNNRLKITQKIQNERFVTTLFIHLS